MMDKDKTPLCVDLDGTLIKGDLSLKAFFRYFKKFPFKIYRLLIWELAGRAQTKKMLSKIIPIDFMKLKTNEALILFLKKQKQEGRKLIIVSGSNQQYVDEMVKFFNGLFDEGVGTGEKINLVGENKAHYLRERFGEFNFDYIGNSFVDIPVWQVSRKKYVATKNKKLIATFPFDEVFRF